MVGCVFVWGWCWLFCFDLLVCRWLGLFDLIVLFLGCLLLVVFLFGVWWALLLICVALVVGRLLAICLVICLGFGVLVFGLVDLV